MQTKTCNYLIEVFKLPADLAIAIQKDTHHLYETAIIYQRLIDSKLLWKIWQIDEYGKLWIEVNLIGKNGKAAFHTIAVDEGTFNKIDFEVYQVL